MKSFIKLSLTVIICSVIFSACNKSNTLGKMIPKNALVIVHINQKSLSSKVSWNDVKQTAWFKEMYADSSTGKAWIKSLMDNPDNSGIDAADLVFFLAKNSSQEMQFVLEGDIKDAKMFEAFNKHLDEKSSAIKDGDINMITLHNNVVAGWDDKKFAYVINMPSTGRYGSFGADVMSPAFQDSTNTAIAIDPHQLPAACKKLFSLPTDSNMSKVEKFSSLLKEDGDIHMWQNTEAAMNSMPAMGMLGMLKLDVFFKDNISTATVNFDNGKISFKQKTYVGKELADVLKKSGNTNLNTDMIKNIPSQNVDALFAMHFNPETAGNIIKLAGIDGFINMALMQQGLTFDNIIKATKGDILFVLSALSVKPDTSVGMAAYKKPDMKFLFSTAIGDNTSFDKLLNIGKKMGKDLHNDSSILNSRNDKYFVMGNSPDYNSKYLSGNSNNKFDFTNRISDHPAGGFVDLHKILMAVSNGVTDSSKKVVMAESIKTWDNIYFMGGEFNDGAFTFSGEMNFVDKNTNSLKQLNNYIDNISKVMLEKDKKRKAEEEYMNGTHDVQVIPPSDSVNKNHK